jgi:hypothetical protein
MEAIATCCLAPASHASMRRAMVLSRRRHGAEKDADAVARREAAAAGELGLVVVVEVAPDDEPHWRLVAQELPQPMLSGGPEKTAHLGLLQVTKHKDLDAMDVRLLGSRWARKYEGCVLLRTRIPGRDGRGVCR